MDSLSLDAVLLQSGVKYEQNTGFTYDKNSIFDTLNEKDVLIENDENELGTYTSITYYDNENKTRIRHLLADRDFDNKFDDYQLSILKTDNNNGFYSDELVFCNDDDFDGTFDFIGYSYGQYIPSNNFYGNVNAYDENADGKIDYYGRY